MGFTLNQLEQERQIRKLQKKDDKDTSNYEQLSNLPKINNVELKGEKTTSDLGINANNIMMSDGASVEADLASAVPRTASGTTLVQLNDAVAQLTNNQRRLSSIWVNNTLLLRYSYENRYQNISVTTTSGKIQDYRITLGNNPSYIAIESDGSTVAQATLAVTSWILYYQGTPIS